MDSVAADSDLVRSYAREGSETAFRALVARHINLVFAAAFRQVGDSGIAEEITQNVFVALARKAPRLVGHETIAGWLHRTAILESKARIRSELRRRRREETAATLSEGMAEVSVAAHADLTPLLDEALLNLRETDRVAVVLRYLEERSLREVGAVLGVDEDAARKRVSRALERLTQFFRSRGFAVPSATGAAVLGQAATQAAPAGLVGSASSAGLAAGGAASGFQWVLLHLMSMTKIQTAVVCGVLVAVPAIWQERSLGALERTESRLAAEESALLVRVADMDAEATRLVRALEQTRSVTLDAEARAAALEARLATKAPAAPYRWNDELPVARVSKDLIRGLSLTGVTNRLGELSPVVKTALQFSDQESDGVQSALNRFLANYHAAVSTHIHPAEPLDEELRGRSPEEVRVFKVEGMGEAVKELRSGLFQELRAVLDSERYDLFVRSLGNWMPTEDVEQQDGVSSRQAVYGMDHRIQFSRMDSPPGEPMLGWGISRPGRFSISAAMAVPEIPAYLRTHLQDWIDLAQQQSQQQGQAPNPPAAATPPAGQ